MAEVEESVKGPEDADYDEKDQDVTDLLEELRAEPDEPGDDADELADELAEVPAES